MTTIPIPTEFWLYYTFMMAPSRFHCRLLKFMEERSATLIFHPYQENKMKHCGNKKCKEKNPQPLSCFSKDKNKKDGHHSKCKPCVSSYEKARRIKKLKEAEEAKKTLEANGMKRCVKCFHDFPLCEFESVLDRRTEPTTLCTTCRNSNAKSAVNPNSKKGKCKAFWEQLRKDNHCCIEGCIYTHWRLLEADHINPKAKLQADTGEEGHCLSDYPWWACNGGVEAMKEELQKIQWLCRFHHKIKTWNETNRETIQSRLEKRDIINKEKVRVGECLNCGLECEKGKEYLFDWDHIDPTEKVCGISQLVTKSWDYFNEIYYNEVKKCNLLCCSCHKLKDCDE